MARSSGSSDPAVLLSEEDLRAQCLAEAVVLVVDDYQPNVFLLEQVLARGGVGRVVGISDPRQTVQCYRDVAPDLVLLDLHMPHLNGLEVLGALSEVVPVDSFSPVIVLTADISEEAKRNALQAGAKDFIAKPFDPVEVMLRVRNLLETRALYQAMRRQNELLAAEIRHRSERERRAAREHNQRVRRVRTAMASSALEMVFQPVVDVLTARPVGVEALARFSARPVRPPDQWFAEANEVGLGGELELLAVRAAISQTPRLPPGSFLAVNVSPSTVLHSGLISAARTCEVPLVIELTEHAPVDEYRPIIEALGELRSLGVRVAVDDAGSGYASLQHILRLLPDFIKLDLDLTRGVDVDPARRALAASLVVFGNEIGARIIAEGVETAGELDALRRLGVRWAQGYHLGRPGPLPVSAIVDVSDPTLFDQSDDPSLAFRSHR